jgi:hypothetical protein
MCSNNTSFRILLSILNIFLISCSSWPGDKTAPAPTSFSVEYPKMVIGDEWEKITEKGVFISKVIDVKPDGRFTLESRNKGDNSVFNQYYDNQYRLVTEINLTTGQVSKIASPPAMHLKFPLFVGSKWEQEFDARAGDGTIRTFKNSFTVENFETVDVKDVKIKAFRLIRNYIPQDGRVTLSTVYWYSPEFKTIVKLMPLGGDRDVVGNLRPHMELIAFTKANDAVQANIAKPLAESQATASKAIVEEGMDLRTNDLGVYHALLIGINDYRYLPKLRSAVHDTNTIGEILNNYYGFKVEILRDATRSDIISALNRYRRALGDKDNLLIYYAGHGILDERADEGYWLPVDAELGVETNWIANSFMTASIRAIAAKHIMIVADSCYSGKLTRGVTIVDKTPDYFSRIASKRARTVLSSGGLEPVLDSGGKDKHSVFASAFISALQENRKVIDGTQLFSSIRRPVMLESNQTPEYSDIRHAGHDGGDFIFLRR